MLQLLSNVGQVRKAIVIQPDVIPPPEVSQLHLNDGECIRYFFVYLTSPVKNYALCFGFGHLMLRTQVLNKFLFFHGSTIVVQCLVLRNIYQVIIYFITIVLSQRKSL